VESFSGGKIRITQIGIIKIKNMSNKTTKKVNGVTQLDDKMENMRLTVIDLELKARFWRAQAEIKRYTLEHAELEPKYQEYIKAEQDKADALKKEYDENLKKLQETIEKEQTDQEQVDENK
jgi:hypothetical protein